jgi:diguanylate cyclase (GGDEF)-like protein
MSTTRNPVDYPPSALLLIGLALLSVVCALDHFTGNSTTFGFFYLVPIYFVAWYLGKIPGVLFAVISYFAIAVVDVGLHPAEVFARVRSTDALPALLFFVLTAVLLSHLGVAYRLERNLSSHDYLTGVFNRREFFHLAEVERLRAIRYARALTLVFIDLDDFKAVNDHFGHAAGDALLSTVARTLKSGVRATDLVSRLGGDEFILMLEESDSESAKLVVSKLRESLAAQLAQGSCPVTASMGVVTFVAPPASVDEMVHAADELMYAAKKAGGDRAIFRVSLGGLEKDDSRVVGA